MLGQALSVCLHETSRMKNLLLLRWNGSARLVARFGSARLIRNKSGRFELRGGSKSEHLEAREWASLFLHEAAV